MHPKHEPDPSIFAEPAEDASHDTLQKKAAHSARHGLWLCLLYIVLYGGFIALATFRHDLMVRTPLGGINLAILYGMTLIGAALLLALVYMYLCREKTSDGRRTAE